MSTEMTDWATREAGNGAAAVIASASARDDVGALAQVMNVLDGLDDTDRERVLAFVSAAYSTGAKRAKR